MAQMVILAFGELILEESPDGESRESLTTVSGHESIWIRLKDLAA